MPLLRLAERATTRFSLFLVWKGMGRNVLLVLFLPDVYKGVIWDDALCFTLRAGGGKIDLCQYIEQILLKLPSYSSMNLRMMPDGRLYMSL